MFAKKVSKMIERRTNENMKNYGMTLYDAFEEAAHKFAKKVLNFIKHGIRVIFAPLFLRHMMQNSSILKNTH